MELSGMSFADPDFVIASSRFIDRC